MKAQSSADKSSKPKKDQDMEKYGVSCTCPRNIRPAMADLVLNDDVTLKCPHCGRTWPK